MGPDIGAHLLARRKGEWEGPLIDSPMPMQPGMAAVAAEPHPGTPFGP